MPTLIDSHCHLTSEALRNDVEAVLQRAGEAGVTQCVTIATDLADAHRAMALSSRFPNVRVVAGIHPHEAGKVEAGWDEQLTAIVERPDVVAVGEMGLDYHYDFADRPTQSRVFRKQLEVAAAVGKPVVIHCRDAHEDVMALLRDGPVVRGVVFHCFTGTRAEADDILNAGYWLSLTGVVTFKKSETLREVARMLPAERIMVETDSPYLSPEPVRSIRPNEPAHLVHTAVCMARQRGMAYADFAALASANTVRFFRL